MTMDDTRGLILVTCHFSSQIFLRLVYIISVMMIRSTRSTISLSSDHSKASEECVCVCDECVVCGPQRADNGIQQIQPATGVVAQLW